MGKVKEKLVSIARDYNRTSLERDVATMINSYSSDDSDIISYIKDILNHGLVSGIVSELVYYNDTKKFFIKHIDDINELIDELYEETGENPLLYREKGDPIYNFLTWLAFEETTRKIADELGLRI